ncbi:hypothetical protein EVAR_63982_1 [Eumeta japonica]|uniref:Uncharacterized protein n=1 Tax=Eumeta variegata TaxID=151549 RepID=A0A4C1ZGS4_EUMVA|nr:hypothetical protein EVAR_63982_1 [Eumeta japonica]
MKGFLVLGVNAAEAANEYASDPRPQNKAKRRTTRGSHDTNGSIFSRRGTTSGTPLGVNWPRSCKRTDLEVTTDRIGTFTSQQEITAFGRIILDDGSTKFSGRSRLAREAPYFSASRHAKIPPLDRDLQKDFRLG